MVLNSAANVKHFSWNQTSREYVDMIFDILRTLGYLQS